MFNQIDRSGNQNGGYPGTLPRVDVAGICQYMIKFRMFGELYVDDVRLFQNQQTIKIF